MKSIFKQPSKISKANSKIDNPEYVFGILLITEYLLRKGEEAKARRYLSEKLENFLPLRQAVMHGRVRVVELLLNLGADPSAVGFLGMSPLHIACKPRSNSSRRIHLDGKVSRVLSASYIEAIEQIIRDAENFIQEKADLRITELLLKYNCDVNAQNEFGQTPLFYIFMNYYSILGHQSLGKSVYNLPTVSAPELEEIKNIQIEKLKILLKHNVDTAIVDKDKYTALLFAIDNLKVRYVRDNSYIIFNDTASTNLIRELLKKGIDVNAKDIHNKTALQHAVALLNADVVDVLLEYGANINDLKFPLENDGINFHCRQDQFPCLEAVENLLDIIKILTEKGWKFSPMDNLTILKFLISRGYSNNSRTINYNFVFHSLFYITPAYFEKILNVIDSIEYSLKLMDLYEWFYISQYSYEGFPFSRNPELSKSYIPEYSYKDVLPYLAFMELNGFYIHPDVNARLQQLRLSHRPQQNYTRAVDEKQIEHLKKYTLQRDITLYDLMFMHPLKLYPYLKSGSYRNLTRLHNLQDERNWYNAMLRGHITKALTRKYVLDSGKDFLKRVICTDMPDLCYEEILHYLSNEEVLNLCLATINISTVKNVVKTRSRSRCNIC